MKYTEEEIELLPKRKQIEMKYIYPRIKWLYAKYFGLYGFYWAYKLFIKDYTIPAWEQWSLWFFAMASLYFFSREERLDGFFDSIKK